MPVIRLTAAAQVFTNEQRQALVQQLAQERGDKPVANGPVIFEIPLESTDKLDLLVVWEAWKEAPSETRSEIILEAYKDQKERVSQALGVTYQEAIDQHVLPYAVLPMIHSEEVDPAALKKVMLKHGGIAVDGGKVDLRFPTMAMAEQAHRELCEAMPQGYWSIVQTVGRIY
jgi:hypothetical protein